MAMNWLTSSAQRMARVSDIDEAKQSAAEAREAEKARQLHYGRAVEVHRWRYPELFDREQSLAERADGHQGVSAGEILASAMRADVAQDREDDKRRAEHSAAMDDYRANLLLSQQGRLRSLAEILQAAAVISGQEFYGSAAAPSDPVSRARSARREHRESIDRQAAEEAVRNVWRALNVVDGQPGIEGWARRAGEGIGLQVRGTSP